MHVTHLDDHWFDYGVRGLLGSQPPPHGGAAQRAALRATSPFAASSAPPFPQRSDEAEVLAIGAPGRRSEHRHHSADS